jgi:16S rRNA (guanine527-N7)-methyltransferase
LKDQGQGIRVKNPFPFCFAFLAALRETSRVRKEFVQAIKTHQTAFGLDLKDEAIDGLADYYSLVQKHNSILHLVGPCSPEEFAIRHILESLVLLEYLPHGSKFADVGAGAGLPSIPCLLVRDDLKAVLIESKEKKTKFLDLAVENLGISRRAQIVNKQFQEVDPANCQSITCRALDKFSEKLPRLLKWSGDRNIALFSGPTLRDALLNLAVEFSQHQLPLAERRFIFVVANNTG